MSNQQFLFGSLPDHCKSGAQLAKETRKVEPVPPLAESAPRQRHSPTSCAAAEKVGPHLGKMQAKVLDWLMAHGPATDNEIIAGVGGNPNGPRARRIELLKKQLIIACGEKDGSTLWKAKPAID